MQGRDEEEDCGNPEFAENLLMLLGFAPFAEDNSAFPRWTSFSPTADFCKWFRSRMQEGARGNAGVIVANLHFSQTLSSSEVC